MGSYFVFMYTILLFLAMLTIACAAYAGKMIYYMIYNGGDEAMYKLLLVDDEPSIRTGMRDLIDWEALGYELVAVMDDGAPAIRYLNANYVDVVITDIKMVTNSGIDIARFVDENRLPVKIILISGYKEVDLAMSAIKYNVEQYILKPIDINELERQLILIRGQLDEKRRQQSDLINLAYYQKNINELKDDFFLELAMGSFTNEHYLITVFQLIYPHLDYRRCPCFLMTAAMRDYGDLLSRRWKHTSGELYKALQNCVSACGDRDEYRMIYKSGDKLRLFGIMYTSEESLNLGTERGATREAGHGVGHEAGRRVEREAGRWAERKYSCPFDVGGASGANSARLAEEAGLKLCRRLNETFFAGCVLTELEFFDDILALSHSSGRAVTRADESVMDVKIREQGRMLFSAHTAGDSEKLRNVLDTFTGYLRELPFETAKETAVATLDKFSEKLAESVVGGGILTGEAGADSGGSMGDVGAGGGSPMGEAGSGGRSSMGEVGIAPSEAIKNAGDMFGLRSAMERIFNGPPAKVGCARNAEDALIVKAKRYITDHITEEISLEDIAEKFYLSQYYFSRTFKKKTGENLIDFIIARKIDKAKELLRSPGYKIYEISAMVGYRSNRYFTKVFKAHTGCTPSEYRERRLAGAAGGEGP